MVFVDVWFHTCVPWSLWTIWPALLEERHFYIPKATATCRWWHVVAWGNRVLTGDLKSLQVTRWRFPEIWVALVIIHWWIFPVNHPFGIPPMNGNLHICDISRLSGGVTCTTWSTSLWPTIILNQTLNTASINGNSRILKWRCCTI